jgi:putative membrane protein
MRFLKTLFWVLVLVGVVLFSAGNWKPVRLALWGYTEVNIQLPALLLITFLAGMVPTLLLHRATRWSLRRKLDSAERALSDMATPNDPPMKDTGTGTIQPNAAPIAVPPGVS